ncbi:hypothetical protein LSCM4_04211 [Leishmania orientalis]|uniref:Uncharacterized protein n=1 Tax=Leishmania orientalis TaxID=2249476 RepID=A0A836GN68_9TRYP|nr:hypothetical protein LSCM4_04211 [Leishmania orientalis]
MASKSHFEVRLNGCATTAVKISEARDRVADAKRVILEADDHLRQIRKVYRALGLVPVTPSPPTATALTVPLPVLHSSRAVHDEHPANMALPTLRKSFNDVFSLAAQYSAGALEVTSRDSPTLCTVTSMPNIQQHSPKVISEPPVSVVAANALNYVAAWRKEDSRCTLQEDVIHDCLRVRYNLEVEEQGSRHRLRQLLLTVWEQMDRFVVMSEYSKFVVFCVHQEPMWRQAAHQLKKEKDARLNTAESILTHFQMEEVALTEKMFMFQEAAGFVSQCFAKWEKRQLTQTRAAERRRGLQSARQMTCVQFTPHSHPHHRGSHDDGDDAAPAVSSTLPPLQRPRGDSLLALSGKREARAAQKVEPLSAVEMCSYTPPRRTKI